MVKPYKMPNISDQGLYTTIIPLSSMKEYEFECNREEVNVILSKALLVNGSKSKCIDVVRGEPFGIYSDESDGEFKDSIEVTFDMLHKNKDVKIKTNCGYSFGKHVNKSCPHFLVKSHIDYPIQEEFITKMLNTSDIYSVLVDNVKAFKGFYSPTFKITVTKDGSIIFDTCNGNPRVRFGIGSPDGELNSELGFEVPSGPFKGLLKFMGPSRADFEIFKTILPEILIRDEYYTTYAAFDRIF